MHRGCGDFSSDEGQRADKDLSGIEDSGGVLVVGVSSSHLKGFRGDAITSFWVLLLLSLCDIKENNL